MKKFISTLIFTLIAFAGFSQITIPDFQSNVRYINGIDTMLKQGIKDFDLIIAYRTFNANTLGTDYRLMVLNHGKWQRQVYSDKRGHSLEVPKDAFRLCPTNDAECNTLFNSLVSGKLFTIEDDRMNPPCTERDTIIKGVKRTYSFGIEDGKQVQIWLITHKKSRRLYYYAPDFYSRYCPYGDRKQVLNLLAMLDKSAW